MPAPGKSNQRLALSLAALVAGMLMLSFAAVPLYRLFCQITGYGGTTGESVTLPTTVLDRKMNVFFTAETQPGLPWEFRPLQKDITFRIGEPQTIYYEVTNRADKAIEGMATFNVTPEMAGKYFVKVKCFCYEKTRIEPKSTQSLPVTFYIDPAIAEDSDLDHLTHMALSYTFFNQETAN